MLCNALRDHPELIPQAIAAQEQIDANRVAGLTQEIREIPSVPQGKPCGC